MGTWHDQTDERFITRYFWIASFPFARNIINHFVDRLRKELWILIREVSRENTFRTPAFLSMVNKPLARSDGRKKVWKINEIRENVQRRFERKQNYTCREQFPVDYSLSVSSQSIRLDCSISIFLRTNSSKGRGGDFFPSFRLIFSRGIIPLPYDRSLSLMWYKKCNI